MHSTLAMMLVLLGALGLAIAQTSPEQRQALLDYQLTLPRANQLIDAMDEMTKYVVSTAKRQGEDGENREKYARRREHWHRWNNTRGRWPS